MNNQPTPATTQHGTPLPHMPGCVAAWGFTEDIDEVAKIIERLSDAGTPDDQCEVLTDWLFEVVPYYLKKKKIKGLKGHYMVSLQKRGLMGALRKKIAATVGAGAFNGRLARK